MIGIISGISGQDGSYLAESLSKKGYEVIGLERRVVNRPKSKFKILECDIRDYSRLVQIIQLKPDEFYHLAAQSDVGRSFKDPFETFQTNIIGTLNVLEAIRKFSPKTKLYFAGSSEQFGKVQTEPQNEKTPFYPRSPYGVSKVTGFHLVRNYRESYNLFACSGILFNHESPRRGKEFVTRKITRAVAKIKLGLQKKLKLGNLDAKRDWGYSKDYVEAMWLMLQQDTPDDYVVATNETHSVREFCDLAFKHVDLDYKDYVKIKSEFFRPCEVNTLTGDYSKAKDKLGWEPKIKFGELVKLMVDEDINSLSK